MMFISRIATCFVFFFKMMRVVFQLVYGIWRISALSRPIISIFGSAQMEQHIVYAIQAHQIGRWLIEKDISVLTGGGPGIMEAANCGAFPSGDDKGVKSMGIGVRGLEQRRNVCLEEYFEMDYFWARKLLLTNYSKGFIVFPGGFGTMDELSEVLTLIQTGMLQKVPIVLVGKEFWAPFMTWVTEEALKNKFVTAEHVQLFHVTDDPHQAFCFVIGECGMDDK